MRKKMKKLILSELEDNFQVISKEEQVLYIGGRRVYLTFGENGSLQVNRVETSCNLFETLVLNGYELRVDRHTWEHLERGTGSMFVGQKVFGFLAGNSNVEWGMAIQHSGSAKIFTDGNRDKIGMLASPNTKIWVHSHPSCCDLSDEDKRMARDYAGKQHFLWYNGQFRQFYEFGFIGNWRCYL